MPLVRKVQIVSEYGEPLTWKTEGRLRHKSPIPSVVAAIQDKPFCDFSHRHGSDGTETAATEPTVSRQSWIMGVSGSTSSRITSLHCGLGLLPDKGHEHRSLGAEHADTKVRSLAMAMRECCPSGSLVYSIHKGEPDVEPVLPEDREPVTIEYHV